MPIIPELTGVAGEWRPAAPDLNSAMAPGEAMARAGRSVASVAGPLLAVQDKLQGIRDEDGFNQARIAIGQAKANHEEFRVKNPDQSTWAANMDNELSTARETIKALSLSPAARQKLDSQFSLWEADSKTGVQVDAAKYEVTRARQNLTNLDLQYRNNGDFTSSKALYEGAASKGLLTPEEAAAHLGDLEQEAKTYQLKQADKQQRIAIAEDPAHWIESNKTRPEGMDALQFEQYRDFARGALRQRTGETVDAIRDGMASGDIRTVEDIDHFASDLRPSVRALLKNDLLDMADASEKARRATPEYQEQTVGKVSALLVDYQPTADDFDAKFVEMDSLARTLPEGAVKSELQRRIKDVRDGKTTEIKTHADSAMAALDEAYKAGRFGKLWDGTVEMPTARVINDGFLSDAGKLKSLGLSEDQVKPILEAKKDSERLAAFRALGPFWSLRQNVTADKFTQSAAEAILNEQTTVKYLSPEAEDAAISAKLEAQMKFGRAKSVLADWLRRNPTADEKAIEDKVFSIGGEETRRQLQSGMFDPRPSRSIPGASAGTSAVPVGKDLTEVVKNFEASDGFYRTAYWDVNQWSIGYGTKAKEGEVIDQAEADRRLASELAMHRGRVETITSQLGIKLTPNEADALTSFDFNTGRLEQLLAGGTRSKAEIADKMLLYRNADGQRMRGLENRRAAERELFLNGYK